MKTGSRIISIPVKRDYLIIEVITDLARFQLMQSRPAPGDPEKQVEIIAFLKEAELKEKNRFFLLCPLDLWVEHRLHCRKSDLMEMSTREKLHLAYYCRHFDFFEHLKQHKSWSEKAFGSDYFFESVLKHIEKEVQELREDPKDGFEWIDIISLGLDGAWRAGLDPNTLAAMLAEKLRINRDERIWPARHLIDRDEPIEHDRSHDAT